ncbi:hypothetical protein SASPL_101235 [Salvia splendens]|uniref:Uncharacterized protein n=1 Tax=Salvia splendens TaxID=180675 RepID=A0A8X8YQJ7_SALSN|nr:hypothetical protein SASPL_101235 [Salvia splendens]
MEKKKVATVLSVILLIISANMVAVNSDASDCNDACTTACVNPDPRLTARCNIKCGIRCGPGDNLEHESSCSISWHPPLMVSGCEVKEVGVESVAN